MNTLCFNNDGNSISSKTLKSRPLQTLPTFYIIFNSTDDGFNDFLIFVLRKLSSPSSKRLISINIYFNANDVTEIL